MRRATRFIHTYEIRNSLNLPLIIMLLLIIDDIHLFENIDRVDVIYITGAMATHVFFAGELAPAEPAAQLQCWLPLG